MWLRPWRERMFPRSQYQVFARNLVLLITLYILWSHYSYCVFRTNTHLYPTGFSSLGVWTTGPKTSHFVNEFNFACIASFHFGQSFLYRHSSTFHGSRSSSFLMISKVTWKVKILLIIILFWSHFSPVYT